MNHALVVPPDIRSPRLDLVVLSPQIMDALIADDRDAAQHLVDFLLPDDFFPVPRTDVDFLKMRREQVRCDPAWAPWSVRAVVLREKKEMIGIANFHGPPGINDTNTPSAAEVGYDIFPDHRGAGFATEVARAMIEWARDEHGVGLFISGVTPDNLPSLRINEKLGFVATGEMVDGEMIFQLRLS
jgi:ribosomal-protein-alanine N-acetyltransferase